MTDFIKRGVISRDIDILNKEPKEGDLEVLGRKDKTWSVAGEDMTVVPSRETATNIHLALKESLKRQLEAEAATLGDIGPVAIHGRTGVST